jgi:RNA polymerase subunit RPABC4/transcription elongation factor Spt4
MKRKFAKLCLDCDEVYDVTKHLNCPVCSSQKFWMLGNWLKPLDSATIIIDKPFIERKNDGKNCDDGDPPINPLLANSHSLEHNPTSNDSTS